MKYSAKIASAQIEVFARKIGYWAFNRWARNNDVPMDYALCVIRHVF